MSRPYPVHGLENHTRDTFPRVAPRLAECSSVSGGSRKSKNGRTRPCKSRDSFDHVSRANLSIMPAVIQPAPFTRGKTPLDGFLETEQRSTLNTLIKVRRFPSQLNRDPRDTYEIRVTAWESLRCSACIAINVTENEETVGSSGSRAVQFVRSCSPTEKKRDCSKRMGLFLSWCLLGTTRIEKKRLRFPNSRGTGLDRLTFVVSTDIFNVRRLVRRRIRPNHFQQRRYTHPGVNRFTEARAISQWTKLTHSTTCYLASLQHTFVPRTYRKVLHLYPG